MAWSRGIHTEGRRLIWIRPLEQAPTDDCGRSAWAEWAARVNFVCISNSDLCPETGLHPVRRASPQPGPETGYKEDAP